MRIMLKLIRIFLIKQKSRLAGFFVFCCLLGCQPDNKDPEQQLLEMARTDPQAAMQLARQRLANNELEAALVWWQQAAQLGVTEALEHALRLQQRLEGKLATALWFEQEQYRLPLLQNQQLMAELGFWPDTPITTEISWKVSTSCRLVVQPVISHAKGEQSWQLLINQWQQDQQLNSLPVCFKPLLRINSTALRCSEFAAKRINCNYQVFNNQVSEGDFHQLLVISGQGLASYNNGIVQLPENASLALFRHEFLHIAGFLDEYRLPHIAAQAECRLGRIAPNLLIGDDEATLQRYLKHYGLTQKDLQLTAVPTCDAVNIQAYRPIADANTMQHYELALPDFYWQRLKQELTQPEQLMPVQYYFAYLARQQQSWQEWQRFMQGAAAFGYPAAISALNVPIEG